MTKRFLCALFPLFLLLACVDEPRHAVTDTVTQNYLQQFLPFSNILSVDRFIPPRVGERDVVVHFSQPMVAFAEVGLITKPDFVAILPEVSGEFEWVNPKTLVFSSTEPFPKAIRHEVRVKSGCESLVGTVLVNDAVFDFIPVDPSLIEGAPALPRQHSEKSQQTVSPYNFEEESPHFGNLDNLRLTPIIGDARVLHLLDDGINVTRVRSPDLYSPGALSLPAASPEDTCGFLCRTDSIHVYDQMMRLAGWPFHVELDIPDFVRVGDQFVARAIIHNSEPSDLVAQLFWQSEGFDADCDQGDALEIEANGSLEVECSLLASEEALKRIGAVWESRTDFTVNVRMGLRITMEETSDISTMLVAVHNARYVAQFATGLADPEVLVSFKKPLMAQSDFGGLDLHLDNRGSRSVTAAKVFLNGERIILASLDPLRPADGVFIPIGKLPNDMELKILRQKGDLLAYRFGLSYALPAVPHDVEERGIAVNRVVMAPDGARASSSWQNGFIYQIRVDLYLDEDARDLILLVPIPAGTKFVATGNKEPSRQFSGGAEFLLGSVRQGLTRFQYTVQAVHKGTTFWPGVSVSDRNVSKTSGVSPSSFIEIR